MSRTTVEIEKSTLGTLRQVGRKNQTYDHLINQRITCNALDCHEIGNIEIELEAGTHGLVKLFVCPQCVSKFVEPNI
jgi:hypothetical protein